jgi:hypothetical protein
MIAFVEFYAGIAGAMYVCTVGIICVNAAHLIQKKRARITSALRNMAWNGYADYAHAAAYQMKYTLAVSINT